MILMAGWQMQKVAIGWEIYERTHSAMALGYAGLVQFLPQVLLMLFAGHVTDTHNRKRVFILSLSCNAAAATGLALNAAYGGSIYSCMRVFSPMGRPAPSSCLPARPFYRESFLWRSS